jgi:glycerol-3-phosphate dehydrogenase
VGKEYVYWVSSTGTFPHRAQEVIITPLEQYGPETEVAQHLSDNYGDRAWTVCEYMEPTGE